jgi:hypothetical protein
MAEESIPLNRMKTREDMGTVFLSAKCEKDMETVLLSALVRRQKNRPHVFPCLK